MTWQTYCQWEENLESGCCEQTIKRERTRKIDKELLRQAVADKPDSYLKTFAYYEKSEERKSLMATIGV
jgi:hypothetical protein